MSKRVMVAAVLAVLVAGLVGCEGRTSLGGSELVQSGVQSVTICDKHHARIFHSISESDCHAWYHYTASSTD